MNDPIFEDMAHELFTQLVNSGCDPKNPPIHSNPPTTKIWNEYKKRGGTEYTDSESLTSDMIKRVGEL